MKYLFIRFDAPLMSFGAPIVDNRGEIQAFPALSMLTGLLGNALGFDHREFDRLERLQGCIQYASRQDRRGERIEDFQTVDLSQDFLESTRAWTTAGKVESSGGGRHIRHREYWAGAIHTVAVRLESEPMGPNLDDIARALREPERPLFIGRKTCLPGRNLYAGRAEAESWLEALRAAPLPDVVEERADGESVRLMAWRPVRPDHDSPRARPVTDRRDWSNQIHVGERWIEETSVEVPIREDDDEQ